MGVHFLIMVLLSLMTGCGETVMVECLGKLSPGKSVLPRLVEETPKQWVDDVFFEGI
jgi:hypothetical protein